ncbi:hypothetical protein ACIGG6_02575 [Vreelandella lionensis]|uniref:Uncharacterized protein n=1 Tax=Vreelandella lionensis TaxID=1144478 RepID=A0ABW8BNT9_9GAMM
MSKQATKFLWAAFLFVALLVMGHLSKGEAQEQAAWLEDYCTSAAIWAAEEARGVPLNQRTGQPDYKGIAEESCPGMRPALPALDEYAPAQYAMPSTAPVNQLVQF